MTSGPSLAEYMGGGGRGGIRSLQPTDTRANLYRLISNNDN